MRIHGKLLWPSCDAELTHVKMTKTNSLGSRNQKVGGDWTLE